VRLARLSVRDFRNLARVELELPAEGMVVVGENGHGKTNLLEAVYYLQLLRSARGARDQDLVRFGAPAFQLRLIRICPPAPRPLVSETDGAAFVSVTLDIETPPPEGAGAPDEDLAGRV